MYLTIMLLSHFIWFEFVIVLKDDVPPRYADVSVRQSRARLEYGVGGGSAQYNDAYGDRSVLYIYLEIYFFCVI